MGPVLYRTKLRRRHTLRLAFALVAGASLGAALLAGAGSARPQALPESVAQPQLLGSPVVRNFLTATAGTWSGSTPMTFTYQWLRCPASGGNTSGSDCAPIPRARSRMPASAYRVSSADVGSRMRVRVRATNVSGSLATLSAPSAMVTAAGHSPVSMTLPRIQGQGRVGRTVTATPGRMGGARPISFRYQWLRCDTSGGGCSGITGVTARTYTLTAGDAGSTLRVLVTATNAAGSTSAASLPTATVPAVTPLQRPRSTAEPRILGTLIVGSTLTATAGSWTGSAPVRFAFQWRRCPTSGGAVDASNCGVISGASRSAYTLRSADAGFRLRVRVTASNAAGSATSTSNPTDVVKAAAAVAPKNTAEPRILGTAVVGNTLTATIGSWSGSAPMSFAYQWRRCPQNGGAADASNCGVIPNATSSAYKLGSADVGLRLRVRVTASNAAGSATAASNASDIVKTGATKPASTSPPAISGSPVVGQALTASPGSWSGTQPISFGYQWGRCDQHGNGCSTIGGATGRTYVLKDADAGKTLRVRVTARNSAGSVSVDSVPTAVISVAPPRIVNGCPVGTGLLTVSQLASPARLLVDRMQVSPGVIGSSTNALVVRIHVSACGGRNVQGALVYTTAVPFNQFSIAPEQPTGADGWATLQMSRLSGFPAAPGRQQLLVMFVRARKPGENLLAGISTRRLVSFPVDLSR
jgi:hypothetical protein